MKIGEKRREKLLPSDVPSFTFAKTAKLASRPAVDHLELFQMQIKLFSILSLPLPPRARATLSIPWIFDWQQKIPITFSNRVRQQQRRRRRQKKSETKRNETMNRFACCFPTRIHNSQRCRITFSFPIRSLSPASSERDERQLSATRM